MSVTFISCGSRAFKYADLAVEISFEVGTYVEFSSNLSAILKTLFLSLSNVLGFGPSTTLGLV